MSEIHDKIAKIKENTIYNRLVQQFVCDTEEDFEAKKDEGMLGKAPAASICFVIGEGDGGIFYMKNTQGEWIAI